MTGLVCALCARTNPLMPQHLAVTQVGALLVCGGHVDAAFEMHMDRTLRTDVVEQMTERLAEVSFNAAEKATQSSAPARTPVSTPTEAHGETGEAQEGSGG